MDIGVGYNFEDDMCNASALNLREREKFMVSKILPYSPQCGRRKSAAFGKTDKILLTLKNAG